ncbi:MAG: hypothetical protein IJB66_02530 [Oscillospiraceae bacterium]|nr:hypothetical protein [Oscillospiraceae bacterium]
MAMTKEEKQLERKKRKKLEKENERKKAKALEEKIERDKNWHLFSDPDFIRFVKSAMPWLISVAFLIFYAVIELGEKHANFRELPLWIIGSSLCLSAITVYFGFLRKKKFLLLFKIIFGCLASYPWINFFIGEGKLLIALSFLMFAFIVCALIFRGSLRDLLYMTIPGIYFLGSHAVMMSKININYFSIKYLVISAVCAVILVILLDHLREKGIVSPLFENERKTGKTFAFHYLFFCFVIIFMLIETANYCLDFSEGISQSSVIKEKIADTSGKRDSYYFVLDYGGEKTTLKINGRTYRIFETGDTVTVTTYEGFLGDEYVTVSE